MQVNSYLELFLTLYGWLSYNLSWDMLNDTGIVYLPFIGMLLRNTTEPMRSQEAKDASSTSLRRIEIDVVSMLTVVVLAFQPMLNLTFNEMSYVKACSGNAAVKAGATGTTYDDTFTAASLGGGKTDIPIWWYGVIALSSGINNAMIAGMPCTPDIRILKYKLANTHIKDPHVRREVQLFYKDCYQPALARFLDFNIKLPQGTPPDDINWLGSTFFMDNLYPRWQSSREIWGHLFDPKRDMLQPGMPKPDFGHPYCHEWWNGRSHLSAKGLRYQLVNEIDTDFMTDLKTTISGLTGKSQQEVEDMAIKTLIKQRQTNYRGLMDLNHYNDTSFTNTLNHAAGQLGAWLEGITFYPKIYMIKAAAPIIQAVILMVIYMFLSFIMVLSSYNIGTMIFMGVVIFSVKFWTVLWANAHWLDTHLMQALQSGSWFQFSTEAYIGDDIVNFVTGTLFIVLPIIWTSMLSWAGFKIGNDLRAAVSEMRDPVDSSANKGGGAAKSIGNKGGKK